MGHVRQWTPDIGRNQVENLGHGRREAFDAQTAIQKNRGDIGGAHQVLQIRIDAPDLFDVVLEFVVDGNQLFVEGLQFLFAGFQLLAGRAQFLVDGLQLLVGGFQLFRGDFKLFNRRFQAVAGGLAFLLQSLHDALNRAVRAQRFRHGLQCVRRGPQGLLLKDHQQQPAAVPALWAHLDIDRALHAVGLEAHVASLDLATLAHGRHQHRPQVQHQVWQDHFQQIVRRLAADEPQEMHRLLGRVQDVELLVDQHRWRGQLRD